MVVVRKKGVQARKECAGLSSLVTDLSGKWLHPANRASPATRMCADDRTASPIQPRNNLPSGYKARLLMPSYLRNIDQDIQEKGENNGTAVRSFVPARGLSDRAAPSDFCIARANDDGGANAIILSFSPFQKRQDHGWFQSHHSRRCGSEVRTLRLGRNECCVSSCSALT